jgi:acetolactate synthase-1/3 small subunit
MWAIISILTENKPGILFKVTHLFRSRNFNIESISVGVTADPEFSRMTITTVGDEKQIQQIVKQLDKMIDTVEVRRLDEHKAVYRELILLRLKSIKHLIVWRLTIWQMHMAQKFMMSKRTLLWSN